jgi:hypothetical protein
MQPPEEVFAAARAMFKTLWDHRLAADSEAKRALEADLSTIEQVEQFLDGNADADTPSVIATYENRIRALGERKLVMPERIVNCDRPLHNSEALKTSLSFSHAWHSVIGRKSGAEARLHQSAGLHTR